MTKVLLSHPPRPASQNSSRAMVWLHMVDVGTDSTVAELGIFAG